MKNSSRKKSTARAHLRTRILLKMLAILQIFRARTGVSRGTSGTILRLSQSPDGDLRLPPDLKL